MLMLKDVYRQLSLAILHHFIYAKEVVRNTVLIHFLSNLTVLAMEHFWHKILAFDIPILTMLRNLIRDKFSLYAPLLSYKMFFKKFLKEGMQISHLHISLILMGELEYTLLP